MRFALEIEVGGSAFADDETGEVDTYSASREVARLLYQAADRVDEGVLVDNAGAEAHLRDENGNRVGAFGLDIRPRLTRTELAVVSEALDDYVHLIRNAGWDPAAVAMTWATVARAQAKVTAELERRAAEGVES